VDDQHGQNLPDQQQERQRQGFESASRQPPLARSAAALIRTAYLL
jgi:hypothetical protein